jgi:hypothetical protein
MPNQPSKPLRKAQSPYTEILNKVSTLRDSCLKETNPEKAQVFINELDAELKLIAELQVNAGALRKEAGKHIASLRQAHPKGKPVEGDVKVLANGSTTAFLGGKWVLLSPNLVEENKENQE